jgi:hypothetical protein
MRARDHSAVLSGTSRSFMVVCRMMTYLGLVNLCVEAGGGGGGGGSQCVGVNRQVGCEVGSGLLDTVHQGVWGMGGGGWGVGCARCKVQGVTQGIGWWFTAPI